MEQMENKSVGTHGLSSESRKHCKITGVVNVISFDENEIALETVDGMMTVKGSKLHVKGLNIGNGEVTAEGKVDAFLYSDKMNHLKKGESLLTRLFS